MALKLKITKDVFDSLSDALKAEYKQDGDGYKLDCDAPDADSLKRAKDREVQARKEAESRLAEVERQLEEMSGIDAKKRGDIATLEKSWKEQREVEVSALNKQIDTYKTQLSSQVIDSAAMGIAAELCPKTPKLLLPHIKARLTADFADGTPKVRVLDGEGKISALDLAALSTEFKQNPDFSGIIVASKASGGAGGGSATKKTFDGEGKPVNLAALKPHELAEHMAAKKQQNQE